MNSEKFLQFPVFHWLLLALVAQFIEGKHFSDGVYPEPDSHSAHILCPLSQFLNKYNQNYENQTIQNCIKKSTPHTGSTDALNDEETARE